MPRTRKSVTAIVASSVACLMLWNFLSSTTSSLEPAHLQDFPDKTVSYSNDDNFDEFYKPTIIPRGAHAYGFTIFDNLYFRNGTLFVVNSDLSIFPQRETILSAPLELGLPEDVLMPTDEHMRFVDLEEGKDLLGNDFIHIEDTTVIVYDNPTFMRHYYHWWGEIMLGFWRVYQCARDSTPLPFPKRFLLPFVDGGNQWRDAPGINGPLMRAVQPGISIETSDQWQDLRDLDRTVVFSRVAVINRIAAHRYPLSHTYNKMITSALELQPDDAFWEPLQTSLLQNFLGTRFPHRTLNKDTKPVVTYISRQGGRRSLAAEDHEELVRTLVDLQTEGLCHLEIPKMQELSLKQQIELASQTTIMIGVHGNGLTHQLWMPSTSYSTVIEIFIPDGYLFDYEFLSRNVGHQHYAVWNDTYITTPPTKQNAPPDFQGQTIPVHGPTIAEIIRHRLAGYSLEHKSIST
ncbi:hypothetical protein EV361DRAFT_7532 [Lentinula raphanica]|uniref:Glycosyltransferase 61 catalytic domain-containing protein n=1 Tax=Lentinula raphanica TaxID=153919 RepID=A0AA38P019_9AGAR|nr:hypothetical protein F5880DRAFT_567395 [Lentinula raphanica]KAJ3833795.1 hypothetical protein F5878DRAFT_665339 [Lentinula raphanica]KAJ3977448.1 hypothetical protein EV361DRAFT_7532 [Lentinula raphanica]